MWIFFFGTLTATAPLAGHSYFRLSVIFPLGLELVRTGSNYAPILGKLVNPIEPLSHLRSFEPVLRRYIVYSSYEFRASDLIADTISIHHSR